MELVILIAIIISLIWIVQDTKKLEYTTEFLNATPEERQKMIEKRDQELQRKKSKGNYDPYDYGDNKTTTSSSSTSSNSDYTYTNPSTGLPMTTSGTGGVDTSGTSYGT